MSVSHPAVTLCRWCDHPAAGGVDACEGCIAADADHRAGARTVSTYQHRYQQLLDLHAAVDQVHRDLGDDWRDARRAAALAVLLDAAGHPGVGTTAAALQSDHLDQIDLLDPAEQRTMLWLAETADSDVVAGVAALLDHARS